MKSGESRWFLSKYLLWRLFRWTSVLLLILDSIALTLASSPPLQTSVLLGHSVQLSCYPSVSATSTPPDYYIVQWKKIGSLSPVFLLRPGQINREGKGYEGRVSLLERAVLLIEDVRRTDAGLYECQSWNVSSTPLDNGTTTEIKVLDIIPRFLEQPKNALAAAGRSVEFNCTVEPVPDRILWLRNGVELTSGLSFIILPDRLQIRIDHESRTWTTQQGTYQCLAVWGKAALLSVNANLTIAEISSFKEQDTVTVTFQEGGNAVLIGSMPESVPAAKPIVTHNGNIIPDKTPRSLLMPSGNLHIQNVTRSDGGWYQFSAVNVITGERVTARSSVLLEVVAAGNTYSPQLKAAPKLKNTVVVGGDIILECAANGNPPPKITWSKYGGILPEGSYQQIIGNLHLFNLKLNDTGTYVCNASNGVQFPVSAISALDVVVFPEIQKWTAEYEVREREDVTLECVTKGYVKSYIRWIFNGTVLRGSENVILTDSKLQLKVAQRDQAGFYQCFAENVAGVVHATARLRVVPRSASSEEVAGAAIGGKRREPVSHSSDKGWERKRTGTFSLSDDESDPVDKAEEEWQHKQQKKKQQRRKKKKNQNNDEDGDSKVVMIPPTRPEVTKLSDQSVMVRWSVPENTGLPILFFKVQYRDVDKSNSPVMTIDEDIAPHILSYEVPNLKTGRTYRFRIAAVYSNNDNKLGPNSQRFTLVKDPPMRKPLVGPTIKHAEAISPSAIMIQWTYLHIEEVVIEGFFIYYRMTTSAGAYSKVTVLGANTPSHIISHLLPGTIYDIKMQSFNNAGTSDFSNIRTEKTKASLQVTENEDKNDEVRGIRPTAPIANSTAASDQLLYTILGTVLGSLTLCFIAFVSYCSWKSKRRRRLRELHSTGAHGKENGSASKYAHANGTPMGNGHAGNLNGVLMWNKTRPVDDSEVMAETSLDAPRVFINNNHVEERIHERVSDVDSDSDRSEDEEVIDGAATNGRCDGTPRQLAVSRPLIHRDAERQSDDETADQESSDDDCDDVRDARSTS